MHIRLNSALIVGCLRAFLAALGKVFWKASLKPFEGKILTTSKVCCVQYPLVFHFILGYTDKRLIPGLRWKDWICELLLLAVTSLWPHKIGSRDKIYSARWKLMLISDEAKKLFGRRELYVSFSTRPWFTSGILTKLTVLVKKSSM